MVKNRYDYQPIIRRKKIEWPGGARLAFWIGPNIEYFYLDQSVPLTPGNSLPDINAYSLRDYGSRVGIFRLMEVFDRYGMRASVLLNSDVCLNHPDIIEEGKKRNWEWLGHGLTNNKWMSHYPLEKELDIIRQVKETIIMAVGSAPKGWLGPGLSETYNTLDHIASEGFDYVCDWGIDDQPIPMRVRSNRMIAMPYQQGINDIAILMHQNHTPDEYYRMVCDQFDTLYREAEVNAKVMALPLHPFITGLAFRIKYLDKALDYICSHKGVWCTTGGEIADWYYKYYYEDPGPY